MKKYLTKILIAIFGFANLNGCVTTREAGTHHDILIGG
jgi:hypothetical protein